MIRGGAIHLLSLEYFYITSKLYSMYRNSSPVIVNGVLMTLEDMNSYDQK